MKEYLTSQNTNLQQQIDEINSKIKENLERNKKQEKKINFLSTVEEEMSYSYKNYTDITDKNEQLYVIQQKIIFYKDALQKQKSQMESVFNVNKYF